MATPSDTDKLIARHVRPLLRAGAYVCSATIAAGLVLWLAGSTAAPAVLLAGLLALVAIPVLNVVVVLADELWLRQWRFALAALAVLAILIYNAVATRP